ncbi:MAG: chemotaxis response regulator protein-glutamate methylesterase [Hyphomicrobium sp.]
MDKVKVLIVDDSATMRGLIVGALSTDPAIEIVGEAADPLEARQAIKALNPDVITLDIEMPNMSGLDFLERLMRLRPMPVIMVSTLTRRGAEETIRALEMGAVDCIEKPRAGNDHGFKDLASKIRTAAKVRVRPRSEAANHGNNAQTQVAAGNYSSDGRIVVIGASTGGVEALIEVVSKFPPNAPPTLIAQHMPPSFTLSLAQRLDRLCAPKVMEASDGARLEAGRVYLAPGGNSHLEVVKSGGAMCCRLVAGERVNGHCPSVDVLFHSAAKTAKSAALGVILTGMGKDGAAGLLAMRQAGGMTFGQNEASSIVYGMPKAAFDLGAVHKQLSLERIGAAIISETAVNNRN